MRWRGARESKKQRKLHPKSSTQTHHPPSTPNSKQVKAKRCFAMPLAIAAACRLENCPCPCLWQMKNAECMCAEMEEWVAEAHAGNGGRGIGQGEGGRKERQGRSGWTCPTKNAKAKEGRALSCPPAHHSHPPPSPRSPL